MRNLALDGARGIAILAVLLFHHDLFGSGWIGVDLFFVLSGYLITAILRRDRERPAYWKRFYIKRAARIAPPILLLLLVETMRLRPSFSSFLWYFFFLGNFANQGRHAIGKLSFLWSLAVEEHFYFVFPFAVRFLRRRTLVRVLVSVLCLEPVLRYSATAHLPDSLNIYYWTCFRLDGLAMGALLAICVEDLAVAEWLRRWSGTLTLVPAAIYVALSIAFPAAYRREADSHLFNATGYSLLALMFTFLVAYILLHAQSVICRVLSLKPLVFAGTVSYGLYLYHEGLKHVLIRVTHLSQSGVFPITVGVGLLVSWLSFRYYERPLVDWGHRLSARLTTEPAAPAVESDRLLLRERKSA